jgi:hypothetical protein
MFFSPLAVFFAQSWTRRKLLWSDHKWRYISLQVLEVGAQERHGV